MSIFIKSFVCFYKKKKSRSKSMGRRGYNIGMDCFFATTIVIPLTATIAIACTATTTNASLAMPFAASAAAVATWTRIRSCPVTQCTLHAGQIQW